jgi:hypothetical protein
MPALNALSRALLLCAAFTAAPVLAAGTAAVRVDASAVVFTAADKPSAAAKTQADGQAAKKPPPKASTQNAKQAAGKKTAKASGRKDGKKGGKQVAAARTPGPLADFGKVEAPADVVHLANWVSYTRNHGKHGFILIDKKMARVYVFSPQAKLRSHSPVLLGKAIGDETAPGVGEKSLAQIAEHEKTTAAGRFPAYLGKNTQGDDVIWIDYDSGLSMHRVRKVKDEERRFERMATPEADDNRISNGCVNVPHTFYNKVLLPTVRKDGAFIYVLPETKPPQQLFGSFDVPKKKAKG